MFDLDAINRDIAELERKPLSYAVAERLAWLYVIRDHYAGAPDDTAREPVDTHRIEYKGDTEFSRAVHGKEAAEVWPVIDDMMSTIKGIQPRVYQMTMRRLVK